MDGWVKLYRRFLNWQWFSRPEMVQIFIYILLSAAHKDHVWQSVNIRRGEFPTSVDSLVRATGLTTQQVRTCLSRLERTGEITRKSTNKYTVISVCNFDSYQCDEELDQQSNNNQTTNKQQTDNKQITTLGEWKESKNGNNGNNDSSKEQEKQFISLNDKTRVNGFSLSTLGPEEAAAERREYYKLFFFANALHPAKQVKQFVAANERRLWTDRAGNVWLLPEQRRAAAEGYTLDPEFKVCRNNESWVIERLYKALKTSGNPNADNWILRDSVGCLATPAKQLVIHAPKPCCDFLQSVPGEKIVAALGINPEWKLFFSTNNFPRK